MAEELVKDRKDRKDLRDLKEPVKEGARDRKDLKDRVEEQAHRGHSRHGASCKTHKDLPRGPVAEVAASASEPSLDVRQSVAGTRSEVNGREGALGWAGPRNHSSAATCGPI